MLYTTKILLKMTYTNFVLNIFILSGNVLFKFLKKLELEHFERGYDSVDWHAYLSGLHIIHTNYVTKT